MALSKSDLVERREKLIRAKEQTIAQLNGIIGMVQELDALIALWDTGEQVEKLQEEGPA